MDSVLRVQGRIGPRTLLITTAALPLTGWTVHALALHRKLAATRKDPLTGLMRRDAYTARARRLLSRHSDGTAVVMVIGVGAGSFKAV
jgi:GGDEF domain-containing protein